jgi:hypothetical protein
MDRSPKREPAAVVLTEALNSLKPEGKLKRKTPSSPLNVEPRTPEWLTGHDNLYYDCDGSEDEDHESSTPVDGSTEDDEIHGDGSPLETDKKDEEFSLALEGRETVLSIMDLAHGAQSIVLLRFLQESSEFVSGKKWNPYAGTKPVVKETSFYYGPEIRAFTQTWELMERFFGSRELFVYPLMEIIASYLMPYTDLVYMGYGTVTQISRAYPEGKDQTGDIFFGHDLSTHLTWNEYEGVHFTKMIWMLRFGDDKWSLPIPQITMFGVYAFSGTHTTGHNPKYCPHPAHFCEHRGEKSFFAKISRCTRDATHVVQLLYAAKRGPICIMRKREEECPVLLDEYNKLREMDQDKEEDASKIVSDTKDYTYF